MLLNENKNQLLKNLKLLSKEEFSGLSTKEKQKHVRNVLRGILFNVKNGITISQIEELTIFSRKTIEKHLEKLESINIAYKIPFGRVNVYYHNGKIMHPLLEEDIPIGDKVYSFYELTNPFGSFIFIQEKKKDELNALVSSGGLLVDEESFGQFLDLLNDANKNLKKFKIQMEMMNNDEHYTGSNIKISV